VLELALRNAVRAGLIDLAVFRGDDAGGDRLGESEGAADGEDPVAHLSAVGVAKLDGGQGLLGVDFDDGDVGVFVDSDDGCRTTVVTIVGFRVGGELDVDFVGAVDDVVVGDDVATGIDDEAGTEGAALATASAVAVVIALSTALAAEETVEEILHVARGLLAVIAAASAPVCRLLGKLFGVDVDDGGADLFDDLREAVGKRNRVGDDDGLRVGEVNGLLFAADVTGDNRSNEDAKGKRRQNSKCGREAPVADAIQQGRRCALGRVHG